MPRGPASTLRSLSTALFASILAACAAGSGVDPRMGGGDGSGLDGGPDTDAAMMSLDSGLPPRDAGRADAGPASSDASARDASSSPRDSGPPVDTGLCTAGARMDCPTSCGTTGSATCAGGRFGMCVAPAERCNGADDDCDMNTDEGFACVASSSGSCPTSCGSTGTRSCSALCAWGTCMPPSETCNGADDDCDMVTDEGFRAAVQRVTYAELSARHPPCTASTRIGPDCNAAIHRYCGARACETSGFGPVENSGGEADVVCVVSSVTMTSYSTLRTHHPACDGTTERYGPSCNAAIHRFCSSIGFTSGFGPTENSGDTAYVSCTRGGEVVVTSYTALRAHHAGCEGSAERMGMQCNAAIHRFCRARGGIGGFGPIENSGDTAVITCVGL